MTPQDGGSYYGGIVVRQWQGETRHHTGSMKGLEAGKDTAVKFVIHHAPVSGLVKLLKAGCCLRSKVNVVLVETVAPKTVSQIKDKR